MSNPRVASSNLRVMSLNPCVTSSTSRIMSSNPWVRESLHQWKLKQTASKFLLEIKKQELTLSIRVTKDSCDKFDNHKLNACFFVKIQIKNIDLLKFYVMRLLMKPRH